MLVGAGQSVARQLQTTFFQLLNQGTSAPNWFIYVAIIFY